MNVFYSFDDVPYNQNTVVTIGTFDGVHRAHQAILQKLKDYAAEHSCRHLAITFEPHPRFVINPEKEHTVLTTLDEKLDLFKLYGVEHVLVVPFTASFSQLSYRQFYIDYIVKKIGVSAVIEGYNHRFGKDRRGTMVELHDIGKEFNFEVFQIDPVLYENQPISSTRIRTALLRGELTAANEMLGHRYTLTGTVVEGNKRGRTLGYPTANLKIAPSKLIPSCGIYFSLVMIESSSYYGLTSIGKRPTFETNGSIHIETYVYDFTGNLYGKTIKVSLLRRLRDEQKFESVEKLIEQMDRDKELGYSLIQIYREA